MISFTKECEEPTELLEDKLFPVIVDLLLSNMRIYEEKGWRYLQGCSGVNVCEEVSGIELSNINNLSDL